MRIVVDAMGTDDNPAPDVVGGVMAARKYGEDIILVGDQAAIEAELAKHDTKGLKLHVEHASEVVTMTDKPSDILRGKPDSSMHVGLNLVKSGQADGFVSAGNTGATLAVSMLGTLKRIKGIKRPALGASFPANNNPFLIDNGANAECKPEWLLQFALMGSIYRRCVNNIANPTVGLISNGEEDGKGNSLIHETAVLLRDSNLNFVGNVEPKSFMKGDVHVGVTDGFTGNLILKTAEATASIMGSVLKESLMMSPRTKLGALMAKPAFTKMRASISADDVGGTPLLGVNGVVIVAHGSSSAYALHSAVGQARLAIETGVVDAIRDGIASLPS